jgi:HTH-type transcriptional regulator / antitoxin HipB
MRATTPNDVGRIVRKRRKELGLTQSHLAHKVGVTRQWVGSLEAGNPTADLSRVFDTLRELRLVVSLNPRNATSTPSEGHSPRLQDILDSTIPRT